MEASPGTTRDDNGYPIHCRPDRPCAKCQERNSIGNSFRHVRPTRPLVVSRGKRR